MKRYRIDHSARVVIIEFSGVVDNSDARIGIPELRQGEWSSYAFLVNLTAVTELKVNAEAIETAASRSGPNQQHIRCAFIAPSDVAFGIARMFELRAGGGQFMVFRRASDACTWLGIPDAICESLELEQSAKQDPSA